MDQTSPRLPFRGELPNDEGMEALVAVLEHMAKDTKDVLARIDARLDRMEDRQAADFKWLFSLGLGAIGFMGALMAHGFHWF